MVQTAKALNATLRGYFSDTRHHVTNSTYKKRARDFIVSQFQEFGLQPQEHKFVVNQYEFYNIIGILNGTRVGTVDDKLVGVGTHYDTVADTKGVDDNGSGMAAMLYVAKQLTDENKRGVKRNNTVLFIAFDHEEAGLIGSKQIISGWLNPWLARTYGTAARQLVPYGMIVLDTIMGYNLTANSQSIPSPQAIESTFQTVYRNVQSDNRRGDFLLNIYRKDADRALGEAFTRAWQALSHPRFELEVFPLPISSLTQLMEPYLTFYQPFLRSDHRNLWLDNIPAIFLTDSADYRGAMQVCYHSQCDNVETMLTEDNLMFLSKTTDAIYQTINSLSEPSEPATSGCHLITSLWYLIVVLVVTIAARYFILFQ
ncbi:uncharacterized protein YfbL-like [Dreissena polymorpha]|uniref:Peptidase M28 domain-containing protein n=1 Tax=Dreissena polymorpha TaxID=45954 RepID=A0A9D4DAV0_DREPO|nr:uncharacterized protein YfbL-like [Dreissena polymorpha]XP_052241058.1 uncharacterized protein YfbL-like [Dreissena polymorpha]KAH3741705.1 hypothetical protein DPMN_048430 [Dreissena polymorpha]